MSKRAVVLAGGKGTRLLPYTVVLPKPLMPVGEFPILEIIVRQLVRHGFDRITLAVNHHANIIKAFFGDGQAWGTRIDYSLEAQPLSTVAPLLLIDDLPATFLLMNGDILTDLSFAELYQEHLSGGHRFTVAAATRTQAIDYGVLQVNASSTLVSFHEKPTSQYLVSMGVYIVNRTILDAVPPGRSYGFDNLMNDLLARGEPVHVSQYAGYWLDIGRPEDYAQATADFDSRRAALI